MGMDLQSGPADLPHTDWNETQEKQADGKWVNYNYDWMFKPGAMNRSRSTPTDQADYRCWWRKVQPRATEAI